MNIKPQRFNQIKKTTTTSLTDKDKSDAKKNFGSVAAAVEYANDMINSGKWKYSKSSK